MSEIEATTAAQALARKAIEFAVWAAGEGISPIDCDLGDEPEEFVFRYCSLAGLEDELGKVVDHALAALATPAPAPVPVDAEAMREALAIGMRQHFENVVSDLAGIPFAETGVTINPKTFQGYADTAVNVVRAALSPSDKPEERV